MKNKQPRPRIQAVTPQAYQARPTEQQIAARARAIYEESGCLPGHDLENRMRAETELLRECRRQVGAVDLVGA